MKGELGRLKVILKKDEYLALFDVAKADLRCIEEQAHYIIRQELRRLGLLPRPQVPTSHSDEEKKDGKPGI